MVSKIVGVGGLASENISTIMYAVCRDTFDYCTSLCIFRIIVLIFQLCNFVGVKI